MGSLAVVQEIKESLSKELDSDASKLEESSLERCRDMLERLDECDMTLEILTETVIGAVVAKLKQHETLGDLAKSIVKKWKKIAKEGVSNNNNNSNSNSNSNNNNNGSKSSASKTKASIAKVAGVTTATAAAARRDSTNSASSEAEADWVGLPSHRQTVCKKLQALLELSRRDLLQSGTHADAIQHLTMSRASQIEAAMFAKFRNNNTPAAYSDKARSLSFNLKKNGKLRENLIHGNTTPDELLAMTPEQLASAEKAKERAAQIQKIQDSKRLDWEQANEAKINEMCGIKGDLLAASLFTCGRCKSTKTTSTQKQTRSADEPMTVFVLCMNCGKRWKC